MTNYTAQELKKKFPRVKLQDIKTLLDVRALKKQLIEAREQQEIIIENTQELQKFEAYKEMHETAKDKRSELLTAIDECYNPVFESKLYKDQGGDYCAMIQELN